MRNIGIINRIFDIRRQELVDKIELIAELEFVNKNEKLVFVLVLVRRYPCHSSPFSWGQGSLCDTSRSGCYDQLRVSAPYFSPSVPEADCEWLHSFCCLSSTCSGGPHRHPSGVAWEQCNSYVVPLGVSDFHCSQSVWYREPHPRHHVDGRHKALEEPIKAMYITKPYFKGEGELGRRWNWECYRWNA